jgi:hypothetical protein
LELTGHSEDQRSSVCSFVTERFGVTGVEPFECSVACGTDWPAFISSVQPETHFDTLHERNFLFCGQAGVPEKGLKAHWVGSIDRIVCQGLSGVKGFDVQAVNPVDPLFI